MRIERQLSAKPTYQKNAFMAVGFLILFGILATVLYVVLTGGRAGIRNVLTVSEAELSGFQMLLRLSFGGFVGLSAIKAGFTLLYTQLEDEDVDSEDGDRLSKKTTRIKFTSVLVWQIIFTVLIIIWLTLSSLLLGERSGGFFGVLWFHTWRSLPIAFIYPIIAHMAINNRFTRLFGRRNDDD